MFHPGKPIICVILYLLGKVMGCPLHSFEIQKGNTFKKYKETEKTRIREEKNLSQKTAGSEIEGPGH